MQINLPIEIPSTPAPAGALPGPAQTTQPANSFEHYLGSGDQKTAQPTPEAKTSPEPVPDAETPLDEETPQEDPQQDSLVAASLAALTLSFTAPPPPVAAPLLGDFGSSPVETTGAFTSAAESSAAAEPSWSPAPATPFAPAPSTTRLDEMPDPIAAPPSSPTPPPHGDLVPAEQETALPRPSSPAPEKPVSKKEARPLPASATVEAEPPTEVEPLEVPTLPIASTRQLPSDSSGQQPPPEVQLQDAPEPTVPTTALEVVATPATRPGTRAALERSAMTESLLSRQAKAKAAGFSSHDALPAPAATQRSAAPANPTPRPAPASPTSAAPVEINTAPAFTTAPAAPLNTAAHPEAPAMLKAEALASSVSVALDNVHRLTEQLHSTGRQKVELEVQLQDNQRLTISLQMERGELKTTFKTDSTALRDALAQNWGQVSEKSTDKSLRLNPPVFESPSAQNGFSGDPRQPRDGRHLAERETEGQRFQLKSALTGQAPSSTSKPALPVASAHSTSALELYA